MSDDGRYGSMHLLIAFLAGAVAGAVVAILTTPKSGPEMRNSVKDWARDAGSWLPRQDTGGESRLQRAARAAKEAFNESVRERGAPGDR